MGLGSLAFGRAIVLSRHGRDRARASCNCILTPGRAAPALTVRAWASLRLLAWQRVGLWSGAFRPASGGERQTSRRRPAEREENHAFFVSEQLASHYRRRKFPRRIFR